MKRSLRRRYGSATRAGRGVFTVQSDGYRNSHKTVRKAIDEAKYLEARGYTPIVYEYNEARPERHLRIVHGPGLGGIRQARGQ